MLSVSCPRSWTEKPCAALRQRPPAISLFNGHLLPAVIKAFLRCDTCKRFANRQPDEPLSLRSVLEYPWAKVSKGLTGWQKNGVQIVKRVLRKTECAKEGFWLGPLNCRAAPLEDGRSPAKLRMERGLRTLVPDFAVPPTSPVKKHLHNDPQGDTTGSSPDRRHYTHS
ncbi:uncharacterized protein LOC121048252 [Ixodes scapularis]|uniref:uncharacterized protein LOC121048252 n=1 Tax=Ixodes scapularis TaxID=6945 RepID=UPI001AD66336|nr:uncharacterized protein LOC121048252 [Ixodes scapularis]